MSNAIPFRSTASPFTDPSVMFDLDAEKLSALTHLSDNVLEKQSILGQPLKAVRSLSESAHKLAFDSVFSEIANQLHGLSESEVRVLPSGERVDFLFGNKPGVLPLPRLFCYSFYF